MAYHPSLHNHNNSKSVNQSFSTNNNNIKTIINKEAPIELPTEKSIYDYHPKNTKTKSYRSLIKHTLPKNLLLNQKIYISDNFIQTINKKEEKECRSFRGLINKNIKSNTRPINRIPYNHLSTHKKRSKLYFTPNTIKLKREHINIKTKYKPFLKSNHQIIQQTYGCLYRSFQNHPNIHRKRLLYALVTTFGKSLILLRSGDIEKNPGPMLDILETHPSLHKRRYKTYFITCIIKLQLEYQHFAKTFSPILKTDHPNHITATRNFPYLTRYLNQKRQHPTPRLLFALITTISPDINTCEYQLINIPNQDWTATLLDRMTTLRNPIERHINILHPYTKFTNNHKKLLNPPTTIHKEIFDFIHQETVPTTIHTLTEKFPFLPNSLLNEALRIYELLNEYSHPPPIPQIPPPPIPNETQNINNNTQIISWNASSLNTTLPNLQDII